MNANDIEDLVEESTELSKSIRKASNIDIEFIYAFYDKCTWPKSESLFNHFPDFMICLDYKVKRNKILNEKNVKIKN